MASMNEATATTLTPLSATESNDLNDLKQKGDEEKLLEALDKLYQSHQRAGHELAVEMLEEADPRSEFFQAKAEYDAKCIDQSFPRTELDLLEIHLKALHPISVLSSLA